MGIKLSAITSPAVTIGFEQTTYTVREGQVLEVCAVVTSGTLDRDASVQLSSVDDEADGKIVAAKMLIWLLQKSDFFFSPAPGDYNPIVEDLTFSASVTRVCVNVISVADSILEDNENFTLAITLTTAGAVDRLTPDQAIITIIDSGGKPS